MEIAQTGITENWYNYTDLDNGETYYLAVQAMNWRGTGPLSGIAEGVPMSAPSRPLDLEVWLSPFMIHLSWAPPIETGGSSAIVYDVYMGANLSAMEKVEESLNTTEVNISISMIGIQTSIFVKAKNELGPGDRSELLNITPLGDLSRPRNLSVSEGGDHINLTWLPPKFNGGARFLTYTIYYGIDEWNLSLLASGVSGAEYTFEGITPGVEYFLAVSANNSMWEGPLSDINSTTPYQVPTPPMDLVGSIGDGFVNLSWKQPSYYGGDDNVTFEIFFAEGNGTLSYMRWINRNQTIVRGLENGIEYSFSIRASNIKGRSLFSNTIFLKPMKIPSAPRNLFYIEGDGILNLTWDPPMDNGGSDIVTYTVLVGESPNDLEPIVENISDTWLMIDDLINGRIYYITIISWNEIGPCEDGAYIEGVPLTLPSPPANLNITWEEDHILVKWDPPEDDGGSYIWLYFIFRGTDPGNMTKIKEIQGSYHSFIDEDVSTEIDYYYHIVCENSLGRSDASEKFFIEHPVDEGKEFDLRLPLMIGGGVLILIIITIGLIVVVKNRRKNWGYEE
jgi:titin